MKEGALALNVERLKRLDPINFAFVMATGILAISFYFTGWITLFQIFLAIGSCGYLALILLFSAKSYFSSEAAKEDFKHVATLFKWLTFSAATNALSIGYVFAGADTIALILGVVGAVSTVILIYTIFCAILFHERVSLQLVCPYLFLMAIASNYTGILITTLWEYEIIRGDICLLFSFCFWAFGVSIYLLIMPLTIYRVLFLPFEGKDLNPAFWSCMGAAAIAVVDGCKIIQASYWLPFLVPLKPFIEGTTFMLWAWATALIPALCLMEIWKYAFFRQPFQYSPSLWATVFPLGMYTAATYMLAYTGFLYFVKDMVHFWLWVACTAWIFVAACASYQFIQRRFKALK